MHKLLLLIGSAPCENLSSDICGQRRPRSDCAYAQSDQGLHSPVKEPLDTTECKNVGGPLCLLTQSLDTTEYKNGEQMPG